MNIYKQLLAITAISLFTIPAFASVEVVGSLKHKQMTRAGAVYQGEIQLQNNGTTEQEIRVYQTDLLYNYKDYTFYDEPVTHGRSNAEWIEFSPATLVVKPNDKAFIQYEVMVPESDTLKGTYWSVLMVESVNPIDPETSGQLNIQTITRYAVQIITEIEDRGTAKLQFYDPVLLTEEDQLILAVDIINKGDYYISPDVSIELFDESGNSVKKLNADKKGLFPTTSGRYRIKLEGLEANQEYQAVIIAAGEGEDVFGLEYTLFL